MFALFEVLQLCLVPLSCVWTLLIYPQTGEQVNPAQQRQAGRAFSFSGLQSMKNVCKLSPKQEKLLKLNVLYTRPRFGWGWWEGGWAEGGRPKPLKELQIICVGNVYVRDNVSSGVTQCVFVPRCQPMPHTSTRWWKCCRPSNHEILASAVEVLEMNQVQQKSLQSFAVVLPCQAWFPLSVQVG